VQEALDIQVTGVVQGVGFRPFVYRLARTFLINGWVLNGVDGVHIHAEGEEKHIDEFVMALSEEAPAAARVKKITMAEVPLEGFTDFEIRYSDDAATDQTTLVSPDLATCDDCVRELFDPANRRYRYPFINCTNCGPRFTIIRGCPTTALKRAWPISPCARRVRPNTSTRPTAASTPSPTRASTAART
jgi:hydrogenase maturation protein HypF